MSKSAFRFSRILICALLLVMAFSAAAFGFTTDQYNVNVVVNEDNSYQVEETIKVEFDTYKHGLFRYIPLSGAGKETAIKVTGVDVENWPYEVYTESGSKVIKIGDPDQTVTGRQTYRYSYVMRIFDDGNTESDMLYIDLLPTDWETPIESSVITITLPKDIDESKLEVYASGYGSSETVKNVTWRYDGERRTLTIKGEDLRRGVGVTVYCPLEEGYWVGQMNSDWAKPLTAAVPLAVLAIAAALWFAFGRDRQVVEVVEFYPPEGMSPAEVGYVIDGQVNKNDLMSMIMYFADKGYMSINEYEEEKFEFTKLKDIAGSEKMFARTLFDGIFSGGKTVIKMEDLDEDFGESYTDAMSQISDAFAGSSKQIETKSVVVAVISILAIVAGFILTLTFGGIYVHFSEMGIIGIAAAIPALTGTLMLLIGENSKHSMKKAPLMILNVIGGLVGAAGIIGGCVLLMRTVGEAFYAGVFGVSMTAAMIFTAHMYRRTDKGAKLLGRVLGFKNFIRAAEVDRINMLVEENPSYFFNILPYAYVMGLTDKWAEHFEHIKLVQPGWYTSYDDGRMMTWNYWHFSRMMRKCGNHVYDNIKFDIDSGSDSGGGVFGGGGGGFSGGGFGGGGGGSW